MDPEILQKEGHWVDCEPKYWSICYYQDNLNTIPSLQPQHVDFVSSLNSVFSCKSFIFFFDSSKFKTTKVWLTSPFHLWKWRKTIFFSYYSEYYHCSKQQSSSCSVLKLQHIPTKMESNCYTTHPWNLELPACFGR